MGSGIIMCSGPSACMRSDGYSTWSVCQPLYSRISLNNAANKRYERLQHHMGSINKKPFCALLEVRALLAHHGTLGRPFCYMCTLCTGG